MRIRNLIDILNMFDGETEVFLQTVPEDYATPITANRIKVWSASYDEKRKMIEPAKIVLTVMPKDK